MLDPRIYRAGFLPVLVAVIVAAFSLRPGPPPITTSLASLAFSGDAAMRQLDQLARVPALRERGPGSRGDAVLARRAAAALRAAGFRVSRDRFGAATVAGRRTLVTVTGERTGFSTHRIVVVANRDLPGRAGLSSTVALLQLAQVLGSRTLGRTLELVSTAGGAGGAGVGDLARRAGGPVDAVIVLGGLAAARSHRPWVIPWSSGGRVAPQRLVRTVARALRSETGMEAGGYGPPTQFVRLAFPLTLGAQGAALDRGIAAVQIAPDGEDGGGAGAGVSRDHMSTFGRAALRAVTALDGGPDVGAPERTVQLRGQTVPGGALRLLVGALILPVALVTIDGFARVRRRREPVAMWIRWVAAGIAPFAAAVLWLRFATVSGLLHAPSPGTATAAGVPIAGSAAAVLAATAAVVAVGWLALRPLALRLTGVRGDPAEAGAGAGLLVVAVAAVVALWVVNPFAAALAVPALHLWLPVLSPDVRLRLAAALVLIAAGLLPAALVALSYASQFGLGPLGLLWTGVLAVGGGAVGLPGALLWSVLLGCTAGVLSCALHGSGAAREPLPVTVRGPAGYAGPGSLGGTESALRR